MRYHIQEQESNFSQGSRHYESECLAQERNTMTSARSGSPAPLRFHGVGMGGVVKKSQLQQKLKGKKMVCIINELKR